MNVKTKRQLSSLYIPELKDIIKKLGLRNYSKLKKAALIKKILNEASEELILEALLNLNLIDESQVQWKGFIFHKKIQWIEDSKITKAYNFVSPNRINLHPFIILSLILFLSSVLFYIKPNITLPLFDAYVCESIDKQEKAKIAELALNLNNEIYKHEDIKRQLKQLLADEVFWFSNSKKSKERIKFGTRVYDGFCFCEKPEIFKFSRNQNGESYDLTGLGAYRYDLPKDTLYIVQRVSAKIENGLISKLISLDEEEPLLEGVNNFYQDYWLLPIYISIAIFLLFFVCSPDLRKSIFAFLRLILGGTG